MKLHGKIEIAAPAAAVWALINDPITLAGCVPGVQEVVKVDDRTFSGAIRAAVGPVESTFAFTSVITRSDFPDDLQVEMTGVDSMTNSKLVTSVVASLESPDPGATVLVYSANVQVKGRLAILGEMVLRATASVMIGELVKCLRSRLEGPSRGRRGAQVIEDRYDLIVIGGGSGGCVVASRASEDPAKRVLLVEGGPDPRPVPDVIADPKRQAELILESPYVQLYDVERPDGSNFPLISGHVMGGGSSVNNMSVLRPISRDFAAWQRFGGDAWSYDALLPIMRAIEDDPDFGDEPIHGRGGPLKLHRGWKLDDPADPPVRALIDAAADFGLPRCEDLNVPEPFGVCASPYAQVKGRRLSVADAYLGEARDRPNLTILADTTATRLILAGSHVTGVELATSDGLRLIDAGQVVLAAGTYHSPQLLMLSGIGPTAPIDSVGIEVAHRLDGVGENFQDHAVVFMTFQGTTELHEEFVIPKVRLIAKSDPSLDYGNLHVFMQPSIRVPGIPPLLPVSVRLLEQRSRGRVTLESADPLDLPLVDPSILSDPADVAAVLDGMRFVTELCAHPRLAEFYGQLITPESTDEWEEHVTSSYITYNHAVGTCRMGPAGDPLAVVDPELRVHGFDNLWIADCSVLPVIPHGPTNLSAIMVGEVAARNIARA